MCRSRDGEGDLALDCARGSPDRRSDRRPREGQRAMSRRRRRSGDTWEDDDWIDPDLDDDEPTSSCSTLTSPVALISSPFRGSPRETAGHELVAAPDRSESAPCKGGPAGPRGRRKISSSTPSTWRAPCRTTGWCWRLLSRQRKQDGSWREPRPAKIQSVPARDAARRGRPEDSLPLDGRAGTPTALRFLVFSVRPGPADLSPLLPAAGHVAPPDVRDGPVLLRLGLPARSLRPARWDEGPPWELWLAVQRGPRGGYLVSADLRREDERLALSAPVMLVAGGFVFTADRVAQFADGGLFPWISLWRTSGDLSVPASQGAGVARRGPVDSRRAAARGAPRAGLRRDGGGPAPAAPGARGQDALRRGAPRLSSLLRLRRHRRARGQPGRGVFQPDQRRLRSARPGAERVHAERLAGSASAAADYVATAIGAWPGHRPGPPLPRRGRAARGGLARRGRGQALSPAPASSSSRSPSGIDWFELRGAGRLRRPGRVAAARAAGRPAPRRERRAARRRHARHAARGVAARSTAPLAGLGDAEDDRPAVRRGRRSACSTPCWPPSPRSRCDETFDAGPHRAAAASRASSRPRRPPASWASCAATSARASAGSTSSRDSASAAAWPTTWAWARPSRCWPCSRPPRARASSPEERPGPSLVVVPRSLVFNWKQEAARFTPELRVLDHTGRRPARRPASTSTTTTWSSPPTARCAATSRRSQGLEFDYAILDEAQAIKNADSRVGQGRPAAPAPTTAWRCPARRSRTTWASCGACSSSSTPACSARRSVFKRLAGGAAQARRGHAPLLAQALRPVHPPPHQGAGRQGPAREARADALLRAGAGAAQALRRAARPLPRSRCSASSSASGLKQLEDPGARSAAAAAPGRLPPGPDRPEARRRGAAPSSTCSCRSSTRSSTEGHKALVFSQFTSLLAIVRDAARRRGHHLRVPRRPDPRPQAARRALPERPRLPALPHQPQGRRPRPEPDRRRLRLPARPLVEPGRRGPGHRPRAPHRPDPARSSPTA